MPNDFQQQINELQNRMSTLEREYYTGNFSTVQEYQKYARFNTRLRVPTLASAPTTCEVGEVYVNSGNGKLYVCSATNTWTIVGTQT